MITFFAKQMFLNTSPGQPFVYKGYTPRCGQLQRVSSLIRGNQIAEAIGAKMNPTEGYENDVCIYVKPKLPKDYKFTGKAYLDICDSPDLYPIAINNPNTPVIVASDYNLEVCKRILPNKLVLIPQQHCNNDRLRRTRNEVTRVGCIGSKHAFPYLPAELKNDLAKRGMELVEFSKFFCKQDVIDFYMSIDLQIIWRPYMNYKKDILMNPLKIQNAASFGIPTIALDEPCFKEMYSCYTPVSDYLEFLNRVDMFKNNPDIYQEFSNNCYIKAEKYHIDNIAKLYKELDE
jgi:hypothetical protein